MGKYANYMEKYLGVPKSGTKTQQQKNDAQIKNYATRLAAGGVDPEEALDKRNWFEKATNLPQNQNFVFDFFDLLNRPQQALFKGISNIQTGEGSFGEGLAQGISGKSKTDFKEILKNAAGSELGDREGKLDLIDIVGLAGEVALDPADIPIFKGVSLTDAAFKSVGKGIKGASKLADTGIEKGLKYLDKTSGITYKNAKEAANAAGLMKDVTENATRKIGRLENYKALKDQFKNWFKVSDKAKEAYLTGKLNDVNQDMSRIKLNLLKDEKIVAPLQKYADKASISLDDAATRVAAFMGKHMNRTIDNAKLFSLAKNGDLVYYEEILDALNDMKIKSLTNGVAPTIEELAVKYGVDKDLAKNGWKLSDLTPGRLQQMVYEKFKEANPSSIAFANPYDGIQDMLKQETLLKADELAANNGWDMSINVGKNGKIKLGDGWKHAKIDTSGTLDLPLNYTEDQLNELMKYDLDYRYNTNGFRDLIDGTFGTSWWGKDSSTKALKEGKKAETLSKRQEAIFDPQVLYSGKSRNSNILDSTGKHSDKRLFFRDDWDTAADYSKDYYGAVRAEPGGQERNVVFELLSAKENPEKILNIDANGRWSDISPNSFENLETPKYYKQIPEKLRTKIENKFKESTTSVNYLFNPEESFHKLLTDDPEIVNELKKYKIDISSKDYPLGKQSYNDSTSIPIDNIDTHFLYDIIKKQGNLADEGIEGYFKNGWFAKGYSSSGLQAPNHFTTDTILDTIYKNEQTGRQAIPYNVVNFNNISDPYSRDFGRGLDRVTRNDAIIKDVKNRIPDLSSKDLFDIEYNKMMSDPSNNLPGVIDLANKTIDETQGTNLFGKYDMFTNDNYIMPHTLTDEGKTILNEFNDMMSKTQTRGNSHILDERRWFGSTQEINNKIRSILKENYDDLSPSLKKFYDSNAKFMEENFIKAFDNRYLAADGITKAAKDTVKANEILLNQTFGTNSEAFMNLQKKIQVDYDTKGKILKKDLKQYNKLTKNSAIKPLTNFDNKVPVGSIRVNSKELIETAEKFQKMSNQFGLKEGADGFGELAKTLKNFNGDVAINADVWRMIKVPTEKELTGLNAIYNSFLNNWKIWKTASPTFLMNNVFGNSSNLALGGVSVADQARYGSKVKDILEKGEDLYMKRLAGTKLDKASAEIADNWYEYRKMGFDNSALKLNALPEDFTKLFDKGRKKTVKDYALNGIPYLNNYLNQRMDTSARLMVMLKAKEDPNFLKKLGVKNTRDAISKIMFDPEMLTSAEKDIKKVIPFYTYTKNNLIYHITNMPNNAVKYNRLMKTMKGLRKQATDGNDENMADYLKNNLYIPIPGLDKDGNYTMLRAQLPFGNLIEMTEDPLGQIANLTSPLAKGLYEASTGVDTFTGRDIESFPGQKSKQIPFLTKKQQKLLSDFTGLDVPLRTISNVYQGVKDDGVLGGVRNTLTMQNNIDSDKLSKSYTQISDLQNLMKQYEQKGYEFSTMNELKKANYNSNIANIDAILAKYGIETK